MALARNPTRREDAEVDKGRHFVLTNVEASENVWPTLTGHNAVLSDTEDVGQRKLYRE
jgi:hypothetical protein